MDRLGNKMDEMQRQLGEVLSTILARIDSLESILQTNHQEIMDEFESVHNKLDEIQLQMKYGFDFLSYKIDKQTHNEVMRDTIGLSRLPFSYLGSDLQMSLYLCTLDINNCKGHREDEYLVDVQTQLNELYEYSQNNTYSDSLDQDVRLDGLSIKGIRSYFEKPAADRYGILTSIRQWLNDQLRSIVPRHLARSIEIEEDQMNNKERTFIEEMQIPAFPKIGNPYFQDETFLNQCN